MKILKSVCFAAVLAMPGIANGATDGAVGATSTGSVDIALTINPPAGPSLQILGLDDITLPPVVEPGPTEPLKLSSATDYFCILQTGPATAVRVILSSPGAFFTENNEIPFKAADGRLIALVQIAIARPGMNAGNFLNGPQGYYVMAPSIPSCNASSGAGIANLMSVIALVGHTGGAAVGSAHIIVTVSAL